MKVDPETIARFEWVWDQVAKGASWPIRPGEHIPQPSYCFVCGRRITPDNWHWVEDREHVEDLCEYCASKRIRRAYVRRLKKRRR
jgi:hypothetical protein